MKEVDVRKAVIFWYVDIITLKCGSVVLCTFLFPCWPLIVHFRIKEAI